MTPSQIIKLTVVACYLFTLIEGLLSCHGDKVKWKSNRTTLGWIEKTVNKNNQINKVFHYWSISGCPRVLISRKSNTFLLRPVFESREEIVCHIRVLPLVNFSHPSLQITRLNSYESYFLYCTKLC